MEQNHLCHFERGHHGEHSGELKTRLICPPKSHTNSHMTSKALVEITYKFHYLGTKKVKSGRVSLSNVLYCISVVSWCTLYLNKLLFTLKIAQLTLTWHTKWPLLIYFDFPRIYRNTNVNETQ